MKLNKILIAALSISLLVGCQDKNTDTKTETPSSVQETSNVEKNTTSSNDNKKEQKQGKEKTIMDNPSNKAKILPQSEEEKSKLPVNADENSESAEDLANEKPNITIKNHDLISGGGEKVGTMSVSIAQESQITDEYIKQRFEKVDKMNNSYDILISTESMEGDKAHGVWRMSGGMVFKNVYFEKDENGIYAVSNSNDSEYVDINN